MQAGSLRKGAVTRCRRPSQLSCLANTCCIPPPPFLPAGRLAMDEPNLQCVPKPRAYQVLLAPGEAGISPGVGGGGSDNGSAPGGSERGSGLHAMRTANLRAAFVAPPGCLLLSGRALGGGWPRAAFLSACGAVRHKNCWRHPPTPALNAACLPSACPALRCPPTVQPTTARSSSI